MIYDGCIGFHNFRLRQANLRKRRLGIGKTKVILPFESIIEKNFEQDFTGSVLAFLLVVVLQIGSIAVSLLEWVTHQVSSCTTPISVRCFYKKKTSFSSVKLWDSISYSAVSTQLMNVILKRDVTASHFDHGMVWSVFNQIPSEQPPEAGHPMLHGRPC